MAIFYLKKGDTQPSLIVTLENPDGTIRDLTGATLLKLHIRLNTGTILSRTLIVFGGPTGGQVKYDWSSTDWDAGMLIAGPIPPLKPSDIEHTMEYEVVTPAGRMTHPNNGYDTLRILPDYAQA
jgi:hypothetical protein